MAKKKDIELEEELDEGELDETEEDEEIGKSDSKKGEKKIELDYSMDASERLEIENSQNETPLAHALADYLQNMFKSHSELKKAYFDRKITLNGIVSFVNDCAKKKLHGKNGCIEDVEVFGWVVHYVQDESVNIPEDKALVLTAVDKDKAKKQALEEFKKQELDRLNKEAKRKAEKEKAAKEKEKAKVETPKRQKEVKDNGQLSLFDF